MVKLKKQEYFRESAEILRVFLANCKWQELKHEKYADELVK